MGVTLKYQNGTAAEVEHEYEPLSLTDIPSTERLIETSSRGRIVSDLLTRRRIWNLTVTSGKEIPDESFFRAFWQAEKQWILYPPISGGQWIRVVTKDGIAPISYVDGIIYFPEFGVELQEKEQTV